MNASLGLHVFMRYNNSDDNLRMHDDDGIMDNNAMPQAIEMIQ